MSRFRRALAAATMAVAAAGGGLLIAAAGAVPASASARPAAPGGHTITIHAHLRSHAARGISPRLQCGDFCDPNDGGVGAKYRIAA